MIDPSGDAIEIFQESWWRHQMETFSALLAICAGNSPVNSPHKGQWRGALMFSFICVLINSRVNNREAGDLRCYRSHYGVIVMNFVSIMANHIEINSLWPSDTIWRHKSGSTLAQVMACCLTAPSHYLNECWLTISKVQWHPSESNFTRDTPSHQLLKLAWKLLI